MDNFKINTDETLRETVRHGNGNYPFAYYPEDIWQFDFHRIDWHWHHGLEFLFVAKGTAACLIGTDKIELRQGCGIFINSGILHRFEAKASTFTPNIVFSPTLPAPEKSLIYELQETDKNKELRTVQLLLEIWDILFEHLELTSDSKDMRRFNHKQARLQTMMQYIHDHYMEEITLEMIAASASVSKSGALHIFKSGICISPVAYLIQYRLSQAAEQLYTTRKSISSIALETGFTSTGYFCRKFRQRYRMSAGEYRQKKA